MAVTETKKHPSENIFLREMDGDDIIAERIEAERKRLLEEAGLNDHGPTHFKKPQEHEFTKAQRAHTTLLFGGLTFRQDSLVKAAMEGLGYSLETVPTPAKADFQAGKEFGNNGQCNPTYFTVGALVNYLRDLRDNQSVSTEEIKKNYIYVTAGACGPCRFGMYEAEFRLALRNSGFDEFRVLLFQQKGGMKQSANDAGLELNINFAIQLLNGILIGDLLNELAYQIRPYEIEEGQVNRVMERVMDKVRERLSATPEERPGSTFTDRMVAKLLTPTGDSQQVEKVVTQLRSRYYTSILAECKEMMDREIRVDFTRPKPICKITGEFWAQTTEGDGNYHMFQFMESQGAEVLVEPVMTWLNYMLVQERSKLIDQKGLNAPSGLAGRVSYPFAYGLKRLWLVLGGKLLNREFNRIRAALGGTTHPQICQLELQRIADPYYNRKSGGGEGHLEVAKNIYYSNKNLAHMVMSLKPFGCMPSSQSDGAQAAVTSHFSDMIYIPIETSGEGDVNAHSRAQMALGEAKIRCKEEFKAQVEKTGYTIEQIRAYCRDHPERQSPFQHIPHREGVVGKAANFVGYVAEKMKRDGWEN